jgi:hypothetical protein
MANEFLPKIKTFKEKYKEVNEKELTDDDIIALLDQHLQREIIPEEEEPIEEDEKDDHRSNDDETPETDEIEKFSESQMKLLEDLENKIKEITDSVSKIKRKTPPKGDISDKALTNKEKLKINWFETDI